MITLALFSWASDKFLCPLWLYINFPYLHGAWHIFIALAAYQACVVMAFFDAQKKVPYLYPMLKYWPSDKVEVLCIPYVTFPEGENIAEKQC
jgi:alkaline ceramidase